MSNLVKSTEIYEPTDSNQALEMAKILVNSRMLPRAVTTPEAAFAIIVTGRELGLTAMQSLRSIHIIEGKPTLSADLMVALVKRSDDCEWFRIVETSNSVATYETKRKGDPEPTRMSFTIEDAQRAQVTSKDNWKKYPAAMLRARCSAALARAVYPEAAMGLYDPDELQTVEPRPLAKTEPEPIAIVAAAAPAPAANDVTTSWQTEIQAARNTNELRSVAKRIYAAVQSGQVDDLERQRLASVYEAQLKTVVA